MKMKSILMLLLGLVVAPAGAVTTTGADTNAVAEQAVQYDAATDRLSIEVQEMSLARLLAQVSRQTGVEILIDPAVERPVSTVIREQPLEKAITELTRGLNTVLVHDVRTLPGSGERNVLISVQLLPKGQTNTALLVPVLSPEAEAMLRADGQDPAALGAGRVNERRLARLQLLPPEKRARAEESEQQQVQKEVARKVGKAERKVERKQDKLARLNERLQQVQSRNGDSPERKQQKIAALTQKIAEAQADLNGLPKP